MPPPRPILLDGGEASCSDGRTPYASTALPPPQLPLLSGDGALCCGVCTLRWLPHPPPPMPLLLGSGEDSCGDESEWISGSLSNPPPPLLPPLPLLDSGGDSGGGGWTLYLLLPSPKRRLPSPLPPLTKLVCWRWCSMLRRLDSVPATLAAAAATAAGLGGAGLRVAADGLRARHLLCCGDLATLSDSVMECLRLSTTTVRSTSCPEDRRRAERATPSASDLEYGCFGVPATRSASDSEYRRLEAPTSLSDSNLGHQQLGVPAIRGAIDLVNQLLQALRMRNTRNLKCQRLGGLARQSTCESDGQRLGIGGHQLEVPAAMSTNDSEYRLLKVLATPMSDDLEYRRHGMSGPQSIDGSERNRLRVPAKRKSRWAIVQEARKWRMNAKTFDNRS